MESYYRVKTRKSKAVKKRIYHRKEFIAVTKQHDRENERYNVVYSKQSHG